MEPHPLLLDLKCRFEAAANAEIALGKAAYMRNRFSFLGLPKPQRAIAQKAVFKTYPVLEEAELILLLETLWASNFREFHYAALELAVFHEKLHTPGLLPTLLHLARHHQWWDTIDPLAASLIGKLALRYPELKPEIAGWIKSEDFWLRRVAILFQLKHKRKTDEALLFSLFGFSIKIVFTLHTGETPWAFCQSSFDVGGTKSF